MAVVLLLTLSACGASNEDAATDSTTTTTTHTDGGESTSTTTAMGEDVDTTITEGEATTTESETTTSTENSADKDGSATIATANKTTTTKKKTTATTTKKATTTTKKTATTTTTRNNSAVVCTGYKLMCVERVDMGISMVGNEHMLDYYLGENKYFNSDGDILVYQFEFEKGSLADCRVGKDPVNCDAVIEGNLLKITLKNDSWQPWAWVGIENSKGEQFTAISIDNLIRCDGPIINNDPAIKQVFLIYAKQKYGIEEWKTTLDDCDGYTADWRKNGGKDPSVTKQHGDGNLEDDFFYKNDVNDWVGYLEYILKEYSKMGIKKWSIRIAPTFVCIGAK